MTGELSKIFMGLALVHFQKYWLLSKWKSAYIDQDKNAYKEKALISV